jgi:hypothetical protein
MLVLFFPYYSIKSKYMSQGSAVVVHSLSIFLIFFFVCCLKEWWHPAPAAHSFFFFFYSEYMSSGSAEVSVTRASSPSNSEVLGSLLVEIPWQSC